MSSTNRGRRRIVLDDYPTPAWPVKLLLPELCCVRAAIDPCAGTGSILHVLAEHGIEARGIEKSRKRAAIAGCRCADALRLRTWGPCPNVIMNPPFKHALAFVVKALEQVERGGQVAALLRTGFAHSFSRRHFWRGHSADMLLLERRPKFRYEGTDSCDYAWFVFGPGRGGHWKRLEQDKSSEAADERRLAQERKRLEHEKSSEAARP